MALGALDDAPSDPGDQHLDVPPDQLISAVAEELLHAKVREEDRAGASIPRIASGAASSSPAAVSVATNGQARWATAREPPVTGSPPPAEAAVWVPP